jgi:hypothetical protein
MLLRPELQVPLMVEAMEWQVPLVPNVHAYPEPQTLARLHSCFNLLTEKISIIIRGFLSRIQRLQDTEETSIMPPILISY